LSPVVVTENPVPTGPTLAGAGLDWAAAFGLVPAGGVVPDPSFLTPLPLLTMAAMTMITTSAPTMPMMTLRVRCDFLGG